VTSDANAAALAARLCTACGMCCNGVLFELVRLQPGDSVRDLESLGMKVRRKKREPYFSQPCTFLHDCRCSIYDHRPKRCRMFECLTLQRAIHQEIAEPEALNLIREIKTLVDAVELCLRQHPADDLRLPLTERCDQALSGHAPDSPWAKHLIAARDLLQVAVRRCLRSDDGSETSAINRCAPNTEDEEVLRQRGSA